MERFAEINKQIEVNAKQGNVNTIFPFVEMKSDKKLSIIGIYENTEESIVNGIGENVPFIENDYFYGLSPEFGADEMCVALKKGFFSNCNSFEKFIDDYAKFFTIPASMSKFARALFAKTLVKMSIMFGYKFICQTVDCYKKFCQVVENVAKKNIEYDLNENERSVRLLGQPSKQLIEILNENFSFDSSGELIIRTASLEENVCQILSSNNISLVQGKGYYSGVLPRVKKFIWLNLEYPNAKVMSLGIKFGRSTFATMDAFDSSYIKNHWLLKKYMPLIEELDEYEDNLIKEYMNDFSDSNDENLLKINAFLERSYSAHNLAVSGNIITSDGYLILAKRGEKTIDANLHYCSINGQSEIYDKRVSFYKQSVYEDMPTITINNDKRIDFMGELERETEAELNIFCPASHWLLQGVSFLTIKNLESKTAPRRRFHFNILGECSTEYKLSQIIKSQKKATERFENSEIIGVKINRHSNILSKIISSIKYTIVWLLKSKDLITSIFALAIFFMGYNELQSSEFTIKSLSSIFSVIFTCLSLIVIVKNLIFAIIKSVKRKNTHYQLSIIGDCNDFYKKVHCYLERKKIQLHPIADVMLYEYIKHSIL